jgi:phenylacetate-CoA ligase
VSGRYPSGARWLTRDDLAAGAGSATGLLMVSSDASSVFPLSAADRAVAEELTAEALRAAGVGERDRVVVALAEPAGALWASAAAGVAAAAACVGPRGRMRLHQTLSALKATTLVATPTGAMDFLARLHLEFLLDPLDLGLRRIVLTGEIASKRTLAHLAGEFDATVTEVYASPFSGAALAWRSSQDAPLTPLPGAGLGLAAPAADEPPKPGSGLAELVITPSGHASLGDAVLRTGHVARLGDGEGDTDGDTDGAGEGAREAAGEGDVIPAPAHTVGEHVLVRGVWLSLPRLGRTLARIDGVSRWELAVSRQGTLDAAMLTVTFNRESLVRNPMWRSRIQESLRALSPISIGLEISPEIAETPGPGTLDDQRGQHLGRDRALVV